MAVDFIERAKAIHGNRYDYSRSIYKGMKNSVEIGCPDHGWFWQKAVVHTHLKAGCPTCGGGIRLTQEQVLIDFRSIHGNRYDYSEVVYTNKKQPVRIRCSDHGIFEQTPHMHKHGQGCPTCNGGVPIDTKTFVERAKAVHGDRYDYSEVIYERSQIPVRIICALHGPFEQNPNNHIGVNKSGCPKCGLKQKADSKRRDPTDMIELIKQRQPGYSYERTVFTGYHNKITITCPQHGDYEKTFWNALNQPCPKCSAAEFSKSSRSEKDVVRLVSSIYPGTVRENHLLAKSGQVDLRTRSEIDIYLPDVNLAIEYCGLRWHSEGFGGKGRSYHRDKHDLCAEHGIRLITIFEDEWIEHRDIVETRLRNLLSVSEKDRRDARKGIVREIDKPDADEFLKRNHIQGPGSASIRIGLFISDILVSVMTFGRPSLAKGRSSSDGEYELTRFASSGIIRGAAGKLFAAFLRTHKPASVFSYSDLRWNIGSVYERIGMVREKRTPPNYWYIQRQKRLHRFGLRKTANDDPSLTEWENRQLQGWDRIWDCGSDRFVWVDPNPK